MTPFGLCNSSASFLRFVNEPFSGTSSQKIVVMYMDDIVVLGTSYEDGYNKLVKVLKVAEEYGLNIN